MYDVFEKDLDAAMVCYRLMDSTETSYIHYHDLTFLRSFIIGKWILNDDKPFLPQSQFFVILPP